MFYTGIYWLSSYLPRVLGFSQESAAESNYCQQLNTELYCISKVENKFLGNNINKKIENENNINKNKL